MAKASKARTTKKLDLSTAQVVDGQQKGPRSALEVIGATNSQYKHTDFPSYQKWLSTLDLISLQDHAYRLGVVASSNLATIVDRLERKFLQDQSRFPARPAAPADPTVNQDLRAQALSIMARGK